MMSDSGLFDPFVPPFSFDQQQLTIADSTGKPVLKVNVWSELSKRFSHPEAIQKESEFAIMVASLMNDAHQASMRFSNFYRCGICEHQWSMRWSCTCNDKCSECGAEIEPYKSTDNDKETSSTTGGSDHPSPGC